MFLSIKIPVSIVYVYTNNKASKQVLKNVKMAMVLALVYFSPMFPLFLWLPEKGPRDLDQNGSYFRIKLSKTLFFEW